ncbi:MAG: trigger factor [Panacagrimonas sp.]
MDVEVTNQDGLRRDLRVTIPADRVNRAYDDRIKSISRRARLPGFRPGKAPLKVIQQQYGASARVEVVSELVESSYPEAIEKSGVKPAGQPSISVTSEKLGESLEYVAQIEVMPEIDIQGLDQLSVIRPVVEVVASDIDQVLENLRKERRTFETVARAAQDGDQVKIDFEGKVDGEPFEGGKGDGVELVLGEGRFLPDLEKALVDHKAGDSFEAPVDFPEDYQAQNLQGKTAQFTLTVHEVQQATLPAADDKELLEAQKVDSLDALREKVKGALENERDKAIKNRLKEQTLEHLLVSNPIDVPKALTDQEIDRMRQEAAGRMNIKLEDIPAEQREQMMPPALFEPGAKKRVTLGLLISDYIRREQIQLDEARVEAALDQLAGDYEQPEQVKQFYRAKPEMMQGLHAMVMEDQVVDTLLAGGKQEDQPMSLDELLSPKPAKPPAN